MKILSICGSPRKGNSESILLKLQEILKKQNIANEIILLSKQNIKRCMGCVEYCNHQLKCHLDDDMAAIMQKMEQADGFIFASPNYFQMPPGIFKDFMDRCSIFFTASNTQQFKNKKALVICVGTDSIERIDVCTNNIADHFCQTLDLNVVGKKSFRSHSELNGNYEDIFENDLNDHVISDLENLAKLLIN